MEQKKDKIYAQYIEGRKKIYLMCSGPYLNEECVVKCITKVDNIFNPGT
jgi:hypothetical protein